MRKTPSTHLKNSTTTQNFSPIAPANSEKNGPKVCTKLHKRPHSSHEKKFEQIRNLRKTLSSGIYIDAYITKTFVQSHINITTSAARILLQLCKSYIGVASVTYLPRTKRIPSDAATQTKNSSIQTSLSTHLNITM